MPYRSLKPSLLFTCSFIQENPPLRNVVENLSRLATSKGEAHWMPGEIWETGEPSPDIPFISRPGESSVYVWQNG